MKTILKTTGLIILLIAFFNRGNTQQYAEIITELQKIKNAYADTGYNSFSIKYQYSREAAPGRILDTLSFEYRIKGNRYYCKLDQIELMQNDSVQLSVYNNEKLIVLSNTSIREDMDNIVMSHWDSAFVAEYIDSVAVIGKSNNRTIQFHFTPSAKYSSCSITYNSKTGQPDKVSYVERATQSMEEGQPRPNGIIITMLFSKVNKSTFSESVFDEKKYVQMRGDQWELSSSYKNYKMINIKNKHQ